MTCESLILRVLITFGCIIPVACFGTGKLGHCVKRCATFVVVGLVSPALKEPLKAALQVAEAASKPHTRFQYLRQFKIFLAFVISLDTKKCDTVAYVMLFLEF